MPFEKDGTGRNIRPSEIHLPEACNEPRYTQSVAAWDIMKDVDLAKLQNFPGLGARDILPKTGISYQDDAPQPGGRSQRIVQHDFFAVGKRADGLPVDVIQYSPTGDGKTVYAQQYLFQYDKLPDGETRVTVQNWSNPRLASSSGDSVHLQLGNQDNVLKGISQYYYSGGHISKSEYWTPRSLTAPGPKEQQKPDIRIQYESGTDAIVMQQKSPSGLLSGGIRESGLMAKNDLRSLAPKFAFYDLFAPPFNR